MHLVNQAKMKWDPQPNKQERARISNLETQTVKTFWILVPQKEALKRDNNEAGKQTYRQRGLKPAFDPNTTKEKHTMKHFSLIQ